MQRQQSGGRTRAIIFLFGSLLLAFVAAAIVFNVIRKSQEQIKQAQKPKETIQVVIAVRDLYMGLPIAPEDVVLRNVIPEMVPRDETFDELDKVLGRTPRERILANESIREERLASAQQGVGLNAIVTPGKRAMTIATDTETAVAGLLQAGNFVDVIVTIKPEDPEVVGAKYVVETILQNVKVLAVGSSLGGNAAKEAEAKDSKKKKSETTKKLKPSITVEVDPTEAEKLALAQSRGDIHVVLRSDIDILQIDSQGLMTTSQLIGFDPKEVADPNPIRRRTGPPATPTTPVTPKAEVISGASKTEVSFNPDGTSDETTERNKRKK
ncbi:MAG: Flp pilus assembly protein CpaB [Pseudomonadota bacterium]|nr:Flp pilus assembly protein CpaB [Pseudomonadota bacterium]